jgi:hypothetical protein
VIGLNAANSSGTDAVLKTKRRIGVIAIVLLLIFTVLGILGYISFVVWIVADLAVALVANLILRRIGK